MANFYTPNTAVHLCNVPLNQNNKNQIALYAGDANNGILWSNGSLSDKKNAQLKFFTDRTTHVFTDFTYQRKDNIIRVPVNAEVLFADGTNYCVYQNTHYNGKWFYCYITRIEFINENITALHIKTDVFQTWFFEWYKNNHMDVNFIARNTVLNDDLFKHTLPENLPTGDLKIAQYYDITEHSLSAETEEEYSNNYFAVVAVADVISEIGDDYVGYTSWGGGTPIGCYMYACEIDNFTSMIRTINESGKIDSVLTAISMPKKYVDLIGAHDGGYTPPSPPQPPLPSGTYLNSPYSTNFLVSNPYDYPDHYGIDMVGDDKQLYTITGGLVVGASYHPSSHSFGNMVVIKSTTYSTGEPDTFYYFIYCHLEYMSVSAGQSVSVGQNIGKEGYTGTTDPVGERGRHCHFEVQKKGDIDVIYDGSTLGAVFGHNPFSGESIDPTTFTNFSNTYGYK